MTIERVRVGAVLRLVRRVITVEPDLDYGEIGVRSFGRGIFHKEPVSGFELGGKRVFRIEPGDLILSNVFAWEGAIALASEAEEGRVGSHRFMTFTPVDERIDPSWARWWFLSEPGLELIRRASPGSAGRNRTLAVERFESLEIPLLPIDEQLRVAARLNQIEARLRALRGEMSRTESARGALMTAIRHSILTSVQADRRHLEDVAAVEMGQSPPSNSYNDRGEGIPLLNGPTEFGYEVPTATKWTTAITKVAEPGDLLICVRATIGRMNWADQRYCIGRGLAAIRPKAADTLDSAYLRHALLHLAPELMARTAGSTFANLSGTSLMRLSIPVPNISLQRRLVKEMSVAETTTERVENLGRRARSLAQSVLPAALNEAFAGLR